MVAVDPDRRAGDDPGALCHGPDAAADALQAPLDHGRRRPEEVQQLLEIVAIKALCKRANVEKVEAGPKGIIVAFRDNEFANPEGLVSYVAKQGTLAKVRPDMRVVFIDDFETAEQRLKGTRRLLTDLARIAERKKAA
jgi:transcription-repair coupling factor (superfamily II helicase)